MGRGGPCEAGRLTERVTIQAPSPQRNEYGELLPDWSEVATVWAEVADASGGEEWRENQLQAQTGYKVTVRYLAGVTEKMRLLWRGRVLWVGRVSDPDQRRERLVIECSERKGETP